MSDRFMQKILSTFGLLITVGWPSFPQKLESILNIGKGMEVLMAEMETER